MNNVITILIDSVYAECISDKQTKVTSTPFIDSLAKDSLVAENVYSYGPYTDAATIGLYNGIPTLSSFGYFFGINSSEYNHFRVFHENGYETIGLFYPYYLISSKIRKTVDHIIYTSGFKYRSVWEGKLNYYSTLMKEGKFTPEKYEIIEKCLEMVFDCWAGFYNDIQTKEESKEIVQTLRIKEKEDGATKIEREVDLFFQDKKKYIENLLKLGMDHPLADINEFDYGKDNDKLFLKRIYNKHFWFFFKLKLINLFLNLINTKINTKKIFHSICLLLRTRNLRSMRYFGNIAMLFFAPEMTIKRSLRKRDWQEIASLDKQIEVLFELLDRNKNNEKPFYASLHVLEPHHNISFFSFDSFDFDKIDEELRYITPVLNGAGIKFSGNIVYQLSLRYVDLCIRRLVNKLKERGLLDKVTIMLVSDHGSSYFLNPIRMQVVNTFHKENYNIPLLIFQKALPVSAKRHFKGYYMSEDILPTLFSIVGILPPSQMKGNVIYNTPNGRDYIITEYMGPGVPAILDREIWISVRNDKYVIAYKCKLEDDFIAEKPCTFYDLSSDHDELYNKASEFDMTISPDIQTMVSHIKERFEEIKKESFAYVDSIKYLVFDAHFSS